jgi:hypothetical protein
MKKILVISGITVAFIVVLLAISITILFFLPRQIDRDPYLAGTDNGVIIRTPPGVGLTLTGSLDAAPHTILINPGGTIKWSCEELKEPAVDSDKIYIKIYINGTLVNPDNELTGSYHYTGATGGQLKILSNCSWVITISI